MQSSRFTTHYDGHCYLLEIPKVREYDQGIVTVHAVNNLGEAEASTELIVHPNEDFRLRLHHAEGLMPTYEAQRRKLLEMRTERPEIKTHSANAIQIERAVQQQKMEIHQAEAEKRLPKTPQLKKTEKPSEETPQSTPTVEKPQLHKVDQTDRPKTKQPIAQPPQFTHPLSAVKVTEGQPVTLEVEFEAFPPPQITWYRESFEIRPSTDFQVTTEAHKSTLYMPEVFSDDQGMYMVKAYNPYGMMQTKAMLVVEPDTSKVVETAPTFVSKLTNITATLGEPVSFTVQLTETPTPSYKVEWFKVSYIASHFIHVFIRCNMKLMVYFPLFILQNTKKLEISPRHKFISEKHIVTLLIYEAQPDDSGTYEVRVTNNVGMSRSSCTLTLKQPTKPASPTPSTQQAPELLQPLQPATVEEGKSVTLKCSIKGNPSKSFLYL